MIRLLVFALSISSLFAFPRWALKEDVSCSACHLSAGGGGARTDYGKSFAKESLSGYAFKLPWETGTETESKLQFGLDTRYQLISESETDVRHFPMQLALHGGFESYPFTANLSVNRIQDEFRIGGSFRYEGLPFESSVAISKKIPSIGWRIDDHTLLTRGGYLTPTHFQQEGFPFNPYLVEPLYLELRSAPLYGAEVVLNTGQGFISEGSNFYALRGVYRYSGEVLVSEVGGGLMIEDEITIQTITAGASGYGFIWLGEISQISGWTPEAVSQIAILHQLSKGILPGAELVLRYEFFDPDTDWLTGDVQRWSAGLDVFLLHHVEVKLMLRGNDIHRGDDPLSSKTQFLGQIHFYF